MNETLNVNLNNLTEEERNTLLALVEKSLNKVWKPENDEECFYITSDGDVNSFLYDEDEWCNKTYIIGNCYKTANEAEFTVEKLKVIAELKRYVQQHNTEKIDWNDTDQSKCYIYYNNVSKIIDFGFIHSMKSIDIYFTSREIAEQAVKEIGEERIKKYYFEVE